MGHKTNPIGLRLGIVKWWSSRWFTSKNFAEQLEEDQLIRKYTLARLEHAGIANIDIFRAPKKITIDIHTARPGIVIGRKGAEVDKLRDELHHLTQKEININIIEVRKPELSAKLVADSIARQLESRISYRKAMKKAISAAMKMGAEGIKISCGGRLAGAEIARTEKYMEGRVPLHTLRADIDYAASTAHTTYGTIGVKTWIFKGEILGKEAHLVEGVHWTPERAKEERAPETKKRRRGRRKGKEFSES